jgi:hypothetical protein
MKSTSSPESDIVQREVQVLKKYCAQLAAIQKENADLKRERDLLKDGLASTADDALKDKLMKLDEVTQERDRLRARVQQLEQELANYGNLPQQVDNFKEKSQVLDNLRDDEKDLRRRLDALAGLEDEVRALRQKANKCVESAGDSSDRDKLLARIAELEAELDNCKCKLKELEILKVERNCLKMRVDDLARIQQDYEDLLKKTQGFRRLQSRMRHVQSQIRRTEEFGERMQRVAGQGSKMRRVGKGKTASDERDRRLRVLHEQPGGRDKETGLSHRLFNPRLGQETGKHFVFLKVWQFLFSYVKSSWVSILHAFRLFGVDDNVLDVGPDEGKSVDDEGPHREERLCHCQIGATTGRCARSVAQLHRATLLRDHLLAQSHRRTRDRRQRIRIESGRKR